MSDAAAPPTRDQLLDAIDERLDRIGTRLDELGREDLAERVAGARARLGRPTTIVCIVGEFKQGKSSLVNALVGAPVCPVDDDIATSALTLLRHGETPGAVVRRRTEPAAERISFDDVARFVTESGDDRVIERVDVVLPSPFLAEGLALVDSPGAGGMAAGQAAATLAFLPFADGLVFVSDASSELTKPELDFLDTARARCPNVVLALSKIDICPEWRRIADLNRGHLAARSIDVDVLPVSAELWVRRSGADSGVPALVDALRRRIVAPARDHAASNIAGEVHAIVGTVGGALEDERAALADDAALAALEARAAAALARLEHLRGPGARWSLLLGDRVGDVNNDASFAFRGDVRELMRRHEEAIEQLTTSAEWEQQALVLQQDLADVVRDVFLRLEQARAALRQELVELLEAEGEGLIERHALAAPALDVTALWRAGASAGAGGAGRALQTGLTGIRGAQSGIMMFGMASQFLPAATASLLVANPVLLAVGAVFGGMQLVEDRKRKVQMRRQQARTQLRTFVDDVQFEMGNEMGKLVRSMQRDLRDEFSALLGELQRTWTDAAQKAKAAVASTTEERNRRRGEVERQAAELRELDEAIGRLAQRLEAMT